jgi:antirestriction protein ArdC
VLWLAIIKADKGAIFTAASKASEAAAFLAQLSVWTCREARRAI